MATLSSKHVSPQTLTVSVFTRHNPDCPKFGAKDAGEWRRCKCRKYVYTLINGERRTQSAKTRSWETAEEVAQEIQDRFDPKNRELHALRAEKVEKEQTRVTIRHALTQWVALRSAEVKQKHSKKKFETVARKILDWSSHVDRTAESVSDDAEGHPKRLKKKTAIVYVDQITRADLDMWRLCWDPQAHRKDDRLGSTTAGRLLENIKSFTDHCLQLGWIKTDPAAKMKPIKPSDEQTLPLDQDRYAQVIAATYAYDKSMKRDDDRRGAEMRAIIELQRWTGLRISDAVTAAKARLVGNRFDNMVKGGKALTVIIPDHVVKMLNDLPARGTVDPRYFFWSGTSQIKSETGRWQRKLARLNKFLSLVDYDPVAPKPIMFHSHMLRDTFAVESLRGGELLLDVSKMLGHGSIAITQKYYLAWVPILQSRLEKRMVANLKRQKMKVSLSVPHATAGEPERRPTL
jgi:site-specific recombinase XerD